MQSSFCALLMASSNSDKFCRFGKKFLRHCRLLYFIGVKWLNLHNKKESEQNAQKRGREKVQVGRTHVWHTRVACRIIVAESKLFVAYFSGGAAQFDYADDYDEEVSLLQTTNHLSATLNANLPFSTAQEMEAGVGGEFPKLSLQTVAGPSPRAACLSYQLISMQRAAAIGHEDWQCEWQWAMPGWLGLSRPPWCRSLLLFGQVSIIVFSFFLFLFFWKAVLRAVPA